MPTQDDYSQELEKITDDLVIEWDRAWQEFGDAMLDFWTRLADDWFSILIRILRGSAPDGVTTEIVLLNDMLAIVQNFVERLFQIPIAVIGQLLIRQMPLPKSFGQRIMKVDDAYRLVISQLLDQSLSLARGNLPPAWTIYSKVSLRLNQWRLLRFLDVSAGLRALKATIIGRILAILSIAVKVGISVGFIGVLLGLHSKIQSLAEQRAVLRSALAQDARRRKVRRTVYERVNVRPGPDK